MPYEILHQPTSGILPNVHLEELKERMDKLEKDGYNTAKIVPVENKVEKQTDLIIFMHKPIPQEGKKPKSLRFWKR